MHIYDHFQTLSVELVNLHTRYHAEHNYSCITIML